MPSERVKEAPGAVPANRRKWPLLLLAPLVTACFATSFWIHQLALFSPRETEQLLYGTVQLALVLLGVPALLVGSRAAWKASGDDPWEDVKRLRPRWAPLLSVALLVYAVGVFVWLIVELRLAGKSTDPTAPILRSLSAFCMGGYATILTLIAAALKKR